MEFKKTDISKKRKFSRKNNSKENVDLESNAAKIHAEILWAKGNIDKSLENKLQNVLYYKIRKLNHKVSSLFENI